MIEYLEGAAKGIAAAKEAEGLLIKIFNHVIETKDRKKAKELRKFALTFFKEVDLLVANQMGKNESREIDDLITEIDKANNTGDTKRARILKARLRICLLELSDQVYKILAMLDEMPVELRVATYDNFMEIREAMLARDTILKRLGSANVSMTSSEILDLWRSYARLIVCFRSLVLKLSRFFFLWFQK
jgi:hypothetical protein